MFAVAAFRRRLKYHVVEQDTTNVVQNDTTLSSRCSGNHYLFTFILKNLLAKTKCSKAFMCFIAYINTHVISIPARVIT